MNIGIVGLGRMGEAIANRCIEAGHEVWGYDKDADMCKAAQEIGVNVVDNIIDLAKEVRVVWLMVPAGDPVDAVIKELHLQLKAGDIVIDGGNSNYTDSMRRAKELAVHEIIFLDCGTSGGIHGRANGFCLMVGGDKNAYTKVRPLFVAIATEGGVAHVGPSGTGHYVKMIHNGIEYGLLHAYAEGFHLLREGSFKDTILDLEEISRIWNVSSVIRSFILELAHDIFREHTTLKNISGEIAETGMGKWTVEEAQKNNIPAHVIEQSLQARAWSRETGGNYATKIVAMLRNKFGGHPVKKIREQ